MSGVNTTWVDPTAALAASGLDVATNDTLPATYFDGLASDLNILGGPSGPRTMQLVNEIKGWPPVVNTGDLAALGLWWDSVGTPSTAPSVVAVSGEGITETYEHAIKTVTDDAAEGLAQRWTYADEPRIKSGRVMSALLAIWSVAAASITAKLVNSDASETAATAVTAAGWTVVAVENHTLAGTWCELRVTAAAAGTFYVVPLGANIGARPWALSPRPERYVGVRTINVVNNVDPGGAGYTDVDLSASTSNLATRALLRIQYQNQTNAESIRIRRNGDVTDDASCGVILVYTVGTSYFGSTVPVDLDDGQIFEYDSSAAAGDTESLYVHVVGWWEWA